MIESHKYCEYFDVDETYFPCIDESAINAGVPWEKTYPHETFVKMLDTVEKMLGGQTKESLWIYGAYGTGKSRCAYTLKKILEVPENELRAYWNSYESLKSNSILLEKLIGHKEQGIVTAWRYASGSITSPQQLFFAVQESVSEALEKIPNSYKGEGTFKENILNWLRDQTHQDMMNVLLNRPKWRELFSQSNAEEIIYSLENDSEISDLMSNLFKMADEEQITVFEFTADSLCQWIIDVVTNNNTKIVLIWDEFSGFFRQNRSSLDEFQKIVSLCQETNFYFIIVTHPITSIAEAGTSKDDPMSVVQERFTKIEISLPSNIAFELTGHAFSVKSAAKSDWETMTGALQARVPSSCKAVMNNTGVTNERIMQNMLPIHPMAALVLKNIASSFQSDQRSMFNFIKKPKDLEIQGFQWFIENSSPLSDRPLLTIDMLWDFFYVHGKDELSLDIRFILDTYQQYEKSLIEKEKVILKTILIMQAMDLRLGSSIPLLKPTDQNLSYAFEGDCDQYENECKNIAKSLVNNKNILIQVPLPDGKQSYAVAVRAGDGGKIEELRNKIRKNSSTSRLVEESPELRRALDLPAALRLHFSVDSTNELIPIVTHSNFIKKMNELKSKDLRWKSKSVLALAKDEAEAQEFRLLIKKTIEKDEYKDITVIDALSTPLGLEDFNSYVEYSALANYYQGSNHQQSQDNTRKAKEILERSWKERIQEGQFIVWTFTHKDGQKVFGVDGVHTILRTIVKERYPNLFDFTKGLTETQLKLTQAKKVARFGMGGVKIVGLISGCEKTVLGKVWDREDYWLAPDLQNESITIIKKAVDELIEDSFSKTGRIAIDEIYNFLEEEYGFAPSNLTAFLIGFLLKEYSSDPYRCQDSEGHRESMTPDKLSEMIGNFMSKKPKSAYIISLTEDEKAFFEMTEDIWSIEPNTCTSPTQASTLIQSKMHELGYPIWCLSYVGSKDDYEIVKKYIELVQCPGQTAHDKANELGKIARHRKSSNQSLKNLLTVENCRKGMYSFLERFENGKILDLSERIGAKDLLLSDIKKLFSVQYSAQWDQETGEDEIRKLITEYEVIKLSNNLLNAFDHSIAATFESWQENLAFIGFSCEAVKALKKPLSKAFDFLLKIAQGGKFLPENMKDFLAELSAHTSELRDILNDPLSTFIEVYQPYLEGFSREECEEIKGSIQKNMFVLSATKSNSKVKSAVGEYRNNQVKEQLFSLWRERTEGTKNPRQWSEKYSTPILCCIEEEDYAEAKKVFSVLNSHVQTEAEIKNALNFLKNATFFENIKDSSYRDKCFMDKVVGSYACLFKTADQVRKNLENLGINPYDWNDDPNIKTRIKKLASAEYNAGGSDKVQEIIDEMENIGELKAWLKNMVRDQMELGLEIINSGGH